MLQVLYRPSINQPPNHVGVVIILSQREQVAQTRSQQHWMLRQTL